MSSKPKNRLPDDFMFPLTSNFSSGAVRPTPKLPAI